MTKVGIGIIGFGSIASWGHFPGYAEIPSEARVVALCDKNPSLMESRAVQAGAKTYSDYEALLKDPDVDAVDIVLPHYLHAKVCLAAIEAGKHVLVEKPFTVALEEADAVISAARSKGVKLMVAENTRFIDVYEIARKLLDQELIGKVCSAVVYNGGNEVQRLRNPETWKGKSALRGGGVVLDSGVHMYYLLRWMVGNIKSVSAFTTRFVADLPTDTEDNAVGIVRFDTGALGHFTLSETAAHPWKERLELYGTEGLLIVDTASDRPIELFSNKRKSQDPSKWWTYYGDVSWEAPVTYHSVFEWKTRSVKKEVQHFVRCVTEDRTPLVTGEDGREDVKVALKAYESARTGREVGV